ncbi:MAG TPA: radical SAM protein [Steroidobacteraceae bacterium]|nr:radical SAM protein [Steroidobacteraceae bacterium]
MLSILVCHSYFLRFDPKQVERGKPYPPLATLQCAALLRRAGHQVSLFDAMLAENLEGYERTLHSVQPQVVLLYEDNFNFLSKMCLGKMRSAACQMIAAAHGAGARVIAAGSDVSDAPEPYLRAGADVALKGEGLPALLELVRRLDGAPEASTASLVREISGTATLTGQGVSAINGAKLLPEVELSEGAAWDLVDMDRYRAAWLSTHGYFSLNLAASRGCSFRCAWCSKPIWGNHYLQRSPAAVAQEMIYLKRTFVPDHVWFADDIFGFRVDWVREFAALTQAADGAIPFTIQTRADLLSERMAQALRDAACVEAWLGAESGSQRILDAMNKGTTVEQILTARARLKSAGIRVGFFIQLGYLGEELPDILATRELLTAAQPDDVGVSVSYPLPGTKFHELVKAQLGAKTHWQDSDDLAMMFRGTYSSEFYRAIRDLLHAQVSLQTRAASAEKADSAHLRHSLEQRWQQLLATESQHRTPQRAPGSRADTPPERRPSLVPAVTSKALRW